MHNPLRTVALSFAVSSLFGAGAFALAAEEQKAATAGDSPSYSAGLTVGEGLHRAGVTTEIDPDAFLKGFKDALAGKASTADDKQRLTQFLADLRGNIAARNHAAAKEFLAKNGKEKGVVTTASGLEYKVIAAGDAKAPSPQPTDQVSVHYRGHLLDGTEFDSSYARGEPAQFPVNGVIQGWQEALALMKPGAKWQLFIPPELAYDLNSRPPIPPGSMLLFDVELLKVNPAAAPATPAPPK